MTYIALLRGINVGGNNIIKMVDLKACFEDMKFTNVKTYIQSGNVVFDAPKTKTETLEKNIEKGLAKRFDYHGFVVVISEKDLAAIIDDAPGGFGKDDKHKYDVIFFKQPMKPKTAAKDVPLNDDVDTMAIGKKALYFSRLTAKLTKSRLSKLPSLSIYKHMTIRNWNTSTKLLALAQEK